MAKEFKRSGGKDFKEKKSYGPRKSKETDFNKKPFARRGEDSDSTENYKPKEGTNFKEKKTYGSRKGDATGYNKKPFAKRNEHSDSSDNYQPKEDADFKEKDSYSSKKFRSDKPDNKPSFSRFRDDSRPSDFGSPKKRTPFGREGFRKNNSSDKPSFRKKYDEGDEKKSFRDSDKEDKKPFGKKPFSDKPREYTKSKPTANPNDLDESDFEYGKPKPNYDNNKGGGFKKKPYEKKPYEKKTYSSKKPSASKPEREEDDGKTRLNKYIANAGICSRREADDLIASGVVQVNGKTITEMGYRVSPTDIIKYGGQTLKKEKMVYLVLNKPKDYVTTSDDPQKRRTVLELIHGACKERIYPVGRLDRATTGLLMFTNDGDLTKKLTHPKYGVKKIYHVELDKPLKRQDLDQIAEGIELEDGPIKVDEVSYAGNGVDKTIVGVEIHSGKNRIVRRIFEHFGYNVRKLDRVMFGSITKKDMPRGRWRMLTDAEVGMLKMISSEKAL